MCSLSPPIGVPPSAMSNPFFLPQIRFSLNSSVSLCVPPSQSRSPRHSQSTQSGLADQAAKLSFASAESLETMSEADIPLGFNRMNRFRQSLPLSRSASQNKLRSPGKDLKRHWQAGPVTAGWSKPRQTCRVFFCNLCSRRFEPLSQQSVGGRVKV